MSRPPAPTRRFQTSLFSADGKPEMVNIFDLDKEQMKRIRREVAMIFQDPINSLNPRMSIFDIVSEPMVIHGVPVGPEMEETVVTLLERVGLRKGFVRRYPHRVLPADSGACIGIGRSR